MQPVFSLRKCPYHFGEPNMLSCENITTLDAQNNNFFRCTRNKLFYKCTLSKKKRTFLPNLPLLWKRNSCKIKCQSWILVCINVWIVSIDAHICINIALSKHGNSLQCWTNEMILPTSHVWCNHYISPTEHILWQRTNSTQIRHAHSNWQILYFSGWTEQNVLCYIIAILEQSVLLIV